MCLKSQNFLKNILGNRVNPRIAEQSWDLISKALEEQKAKQALENKPKIPTEEKAEGTGNKRKSDIENEVPVNGNKKSKKDVEGNPELNGSSDQANDTINSVQSSLKVKWCTIGKTILRAQEDKELSLKKFQKKIFQKIWFLLILKFPNSLGKKNGYQKVAYLFVGFMETLSDPKKPQLQLTMKMERNLPEVLVACWLKFFNTKLII